MKLLERVRHVLRTEEAGSGAMTSVGWLCLAPALLVAIFFGQTAFVGSLRADDEPQQPAAEQRTPDAVDQKQAAIDALIVQNLAQEGGNEDYVALRRIFLDLSGTLPTAEQAAEYAADDSPGKYDRIVRDLIAVIEEQRGDDPEGRDDDAREEEEEEDEDEEGDDEEDERKGEDRVALTRLQIVKEKEALEQSMRAEVERIQAQYRERMAQLQEEMTQAQAKLQELAQKRAAELEARFAEAARAQAEAAAKRGDGEIRAEGDHEGLPGEDADDLTPRERRMLGIIRSLEARLRAVEGREPGADRREGEGDRPAQRREGDRREEERREDGDRARNQKRDEGDGEEGNLKESEAQERQEREADAREAEQRAARRAPRSEAEHREQSRDHFAERLYNALRGEDILQERKAEFARRAVLDVLEFELDERQVQIILEAAKGEFDRFRQLIARIAAADGELQTH
jgi:hypothetical protein